MTVSDIFCILGHTLTGVDFMCTAVSYRTCHHYFGRNLDLEYHYNESVTITPRKFPLTFRQQNALSDHYAIIGIATVTEGYPLYYDAANEYGLCMAGLNFPGNASYTAAQPGFSNLASFELIPWILAQCENADEAENLLVNVNITHEAFSKNFPPTPLHWIIADQNRCIVIEPTVDGVKIYDNPVRVLTNNPPFPYHLQNLCNYRALNPENGISTFAQSLDLQAHSSGMGTIGLPGDLSSASRFVRAAFVLHNSPCDLDEKSSITQFFHILDCVSQKKGCNKVNGKDEITVYSSCCDTNHGIYYYTTYANRRICGVDMKKADLDAKTLVTYPMATVQNIDYQN